MTLPRQLATIAYYLIDIEKFWYEAGKDYELTEKENNTRENLHKMASEFLNSFLTKALEDILREEKEL